MASLESLPADQRAVIQLVLQRGRSYDDIAAMLSIDRAAVRQRALDGFDALGPSNSIQAPQRALLTDYLLGQLPPKVAEQVHERLAASPPDRAWARVIASEIGTLATEALPEIPAAAAPKAPAQSRPESRQQGPSEPRTRPVPAPRPTPAARPGDQADWDRESLAEAGEAGAAGGGFAADRRTAGGTDAQPGGGPERRVSLADRTTKQDSSRRGGAILLAVLGAVIVAAILVTILTSGGSSPKRSAKTTASRTGSTTTTGTGTTKTSTKAKLLHQVNLTSPTGSKAAGIADVIAEGSQVGIVLEAQGVPANTAHNAYAVWLDTPGGASKFIGFVDARVGKTGKLETEGPLPAQATKYKELLVTLETERKPTSPGTIVLEGPFRES
jgi:hypothetical protein